MAELVRHPPPTFKLYHLEYWDFYPPYSGTSHKLKVPFHCPPHIVVSVTARVQGAPCDALDITERNVDITKS